MGQGSQGIVRGPGPRPPEAGVSRAEHRGALFSSVRPAVGLSAPSCFQGTVPHVCWRERRWAPTWELCYTLTGEKEKSRKGKQAGRLSCMKERSIQLTRQKQKIFYINRFDISPSARRAVFSLAVCPRNLSSSHSLVHVHHHCPPFSPHHPDHIRASDLVSNPLLLLSNPDILLQPEWCFWNKSVPSTPFCKILQWPHIAFKMQSKILKLALKASTKWLCTRHRPKL